ncbi:MAG: methyltransferase domain-containing protein [Patescibacteria group bacterium]
MSAGSELLNTKKVLTDIGVWPGMVVADFGVGRTGHATLCAARLVGDEGVVYAVDVVPDILTSIRNQAGFEGLTNVVPVWGDFERTGGVNITPDSLHYIFCINNFWCLKDARQMIAEARRLLHPEGKLLLIDWHPETNHPIAPARHQRISPLEVRRLLKSLEASEIEDAFINDTHWGIIGKFA